MTISDVLDGIGKASATGGGTYFAPDAKYLIEIKKVLMKGSSRSSDVFFIVECIVLESNSEETVVGGPDPSWVVNISKNRETALGNVKMFIAAANGVDPDYPELKDEIEVKKLVRLACDEKLQPLAGVQVRVTTAAVYTKAAKERKKSNPNEQPDFTKHVWEKV